MQTRMERFVSACNGTYQQLLLESDEDLRERIEAAQTRLRSERLKILIIGEFSRGKSTFVNALVGQPILPSKVNPTTATINIIRGAEPGTVEVNYHDGSTESFDLPSTRVNRFLDSIVTVSNERAQDIRTVEIGTPGRLLALQADLVDTPGVNDLDQAREEVTFSYLREADAAVMVLDASQPISESERTFLVDKVLGADVNRIVFVVNKADEILYDGTVDDIERVCDYVRIRLKEFVGLEAPKVHAVSAKTALRARFKGQEDPFPIPFAAFERELMDFAAEQALQGTERLKVHVERLAGLVSHQKDRVEQTAAALSSDRQTLHEALQKANEQQRLLATRCAELRQRMHDLERQLARRLTSLTETRIDEMASRLEAELNNAYSEDELESFRTSISRELRSLVMKIEEDAKKEVGRVIQLVCTEYPDLLEGDVTALQTRSTGSTSVEKYTTRSDFRAPVDVPEEQSLDLQTMVAGFGLGWVGAALFGPIGIGAAVIGSYLMTKSKQEKRAAEQAARQRAAMTEALRTECLRLRTRAGELGQRMSERTISSLSDSILNAVQQRERSERIAIETAIEANSTSLAQREAQVANLERRASRLRNLMAAVTKIEEEHCT